MKLPPPYWTKAKRVISKRDFVIRKIIKKYNGKILARGGKTKTFEGLSSPRTIIIEFSNMAEALKCYKSKEYQSAKKIIKGNFNRHIQIVEGI